jgi:hypothetical protein
LSQARPTNPKAKIPWKKPRGIHSVSPADINLDSLTEGWKIDRSVEPVSNWCGGSAEALRLLKDFIRHKIERYTQHGQEIRQQEIHRSKRAGGIVRVTTARQPLRRFSTRLARFAITKDRRFP